MIIKQRAAAGVVEKMDVVGGEAIQGADCVIVDDIVDTAGTLCQAAVELKKVRILFYQCFFHSFFHLFFHLFFLRLCWIIIQRNP